MAAASTKMAKCRFSYTESLMLFVPILDTNISLSTSTAAVTEDLTVSDGTRFTTEGWLPPGAKLAGRVRWQDLLVGASYSLSPYALFRTDRNQTSQHVQHLATGEISWRTHLTPKWAIAPGLRARFDAVSGVAAAQPGDPRDAGHSLTGLGLGITSAAQIGPGLLEGEMVFLPVMSAFPLSAFKTGWGAQVGYYLPAWGWEWGLSAQTSGGSGTGVLRMAHGLSLSVRWSPPVTE